MHKKLSYWGIINPIMTEKTKMKTKETPKFDVTPYIGIDAEIVKAEVKQTKYGLSILLETNRIDYKKGSKMPSKDFVLRASKILGLMTDEAGLLYIGVGTKTHKFCLDHKVDIEGIKENLVEGDLLHNFDGIKVKCQASESGFLTFN